ncbi:YdbL family protein [Luteimonas huabeiensis]|uniref:YdbL family protein n=1 Tax=Luteimonas huabeiensis TaxID=1244513 RepID=UPI0004647EA5|nr:YdbL family protein [Luteimonas huabeiensis]
MTRWFATFAAALALTACVTINVYFPAAEAREAAREFVDEVIGRDGGEPPAPLPPGGMASRGGFHPLMLLGISTAHAQSPDITIRTPAIEAIRSRMSERFRGTLAPHFDSGALGFTRAGEITVRDAGSIPMPQRAQVNQAVAEQNRDARAVYREIAVANGHPEWESQIRDVFAQQWVQRARAGWWYQDASGTWRQK